MAYYSGTSFGDTEMPFGQHKWQKLRNIPAQYLEWVMKSCESADADLRYAIKQELMFRRTRASYSGSGSSETPRPQATPTAVDQAIALELVKEGRRALALKYHPDKDPRNAEKMTLTNATADYLEKRLSLLLGAAA